MRQRQWQRNKKNRKNKQHTKCRRKHDWQVHLNDFVIKCLKCFIFTPFTLSLTVWFFFVFLFFDSAFAFGCVKSSELAVPMVWNAIYQFQTLNYNVHFNVFGRWIVSRRTWIFFFLLLLIYIDGVTSSTTNKIGSLFVFRLFDGVFFSTQIWCQLEKLLIWQMVIMVAVRFNIIKLCVVMYTILGLFFFC